MRAIAVAGVILADSQTPNVAGQPVLQAPARSSAAAKPAQPLAAAKPSQSPQAAAKLRAAAKAPSTPESRSAAALTLSADPVFDVEFAVQHAQGDAVTVCHENARADLQRRIGERKLLD